MLWLASQCRQSRPFPWESVSWRGWGERSSEWKQQDTMNPTVYYQSQTIPMGIRQWVIIVIRPHSAVCVLDPWREWQSACCQPGSHTDCRSTSQHLNEGSSIYLWTPHLQHKDKHLFDLQLGPKPGLRCLAIWILTVKQVPAICAKIFCSGNTAKPIVNTEKQPGEQKLSNNWIAVDDVVSQYNERFWNKLPMRWFILRMSNNHGSKKGGWQTLRIN